MLKKLLNLPNAIVCGPQKAGTTWIYEYFKYRGDICLPLGVKETFYFDRHYNRGIEWYAKYFRRCTSEKKIVEVCPTCFHLKTAAELIRKTLGIIPIICTLRNPINRSFSLYLHFLRRGRTRLNFREAVKKFPVIIDASRYATHIKVWKKLFGERNVLIVFQEELENDPDIFVQKLCTHLNLDFIEIPNHLKKSINKGAMPPSQSLAAIGINVADKLHSVGAHWVINSLKAVGVNKLLFGTPNYSRPLPTINDEDQRWLYEQLSSDIVN